MSGGPGGGCKIAIFWVASGSPSPLDQAWLGRCQWECREAMGGHVAPIGPTRSNSAALHGRGQRIDPFRRCSLKVHPGPWECPDSPCGSPPSQCRPGISLLGAPRRTAAPPGFAVGRRETTQFGVYPARTQPQRELRPPRYARCARGSESSEPPGRREPLLQCSRPRPARKEGVPSSYVPRTLVNSHEPCSRPTRCGGTALQTHPPAPPRPPPSQKNSS